MKTLLLILTSLILLSCNLQKREKTSDDSDFNNESLLTEGEHYIEIDGVKLWYLVQGNGPILIVYPSSAGWGGDASVYINNLKPWGKYRKVVYFEPRGLGKSERLDSVSDYSMNKYVEELELFRRELKLKDFDLVGHCYAGMIAQKYAIKYGSYIRKLILISTTPTLKYPGYPEWEMKRPGFQSMIERYKEIESIGLTGVEKIKEQMKNWYTITFYDYNTHKVAFENIMDNTIFSELPLRQFQQNDQLNYDIVESLEIINVPTLILYGDDDFPPMVKGSKELNERISESKLVEFKECSHWCFIEHPDKFFTETIDFLK
ncbi:MAG: alpha/beta hydrolase [Bacteroidales bacterium]